MTNWNYADLVERLEAKAKNQPGLFRLSVILFVLLGYFCLAGCLGLLISCVVAGSYLVISTDFLGESSYTVKTYLGVLLIVISILLVIQFCVLWARHRRTKASVRLELPEYPDLSNIILELSQKLRAPRIRDVRITTDINAYAGYEGVLGLIGLGRPVLYLGAPLIAFISYDQLRALIAHELVHFAVGHHKFGWLYRVQYPWTVVSELISVPKNWRAAVMVRISFFWVNPFIRWYLPRLRARYHIAQRLLDEVLTDRETIKVIDANVYGSLLIQSAVLSWLDANFHVELDREARRTGVPPSDLTQKRLSYLSEHLTTFPLKTAVWFVLGQEPASDATHPGLAARLEQCGLPTDRKDLSVLDRLSSLLTFSSTEQTAIQVTKFLKELDQLLYDVLAEPWATASVNARNYSTRLQFLDKTLGAREPSEAEAWERLQLIGLFGPKSRHLAEIQKFHEQYVNHIGGKILFAALGWHQGDSSMLNQSENFIQQAPEYTPIIVEALEIFYAKQFRFEEAHQQAEQRRAFTREQKTLERERGLITSRDRFISSPTGNQQRSDLATKLGQTGLVKRAYLLAKAVEIKNTPSFDILALKLFHSIGEGRQRQVQLLRLKSVLQGTRFTVLLLEKRNSGLEKIFRRIPNAELGFYASFTKGQTALDVVREVDHENEQTRSIEEINRKATPPPLPYSVPPPPPAPADETKKNNPGLLVLAGITAVSIFASIVIVGVFVARLNTWQAAAPGSSKARAEEETNPEEAISKLTYAIQNDPTNPDLFLKRGNVFANAARYSEAIADYDRVVQLQPDNAQPYFLRGNLEEYQGRSAQALSDYGQAIRYGPNPVSAYQRRGKLYFKLKKYDEAVSDLSKAIELAPNMQTSYWDRAMAYAGKLDHEKAIEDYTTAVSFGIAPNILVERGEEYLKIGDYQKALTDFNRVMQIKGESVPARLGRAQCYYQLQDYDHTIADCSAVIKSAPRYADAYRLRAQAYQQKQQLTEADVDLEIAKRLQPK